jgi:hypothetical protein
MPAVNLITKILAIVIIGEVILRQPISALGEFFKFYFHFYRREKKQWQRRKVNWYLFVYLPAEVLSTAVAFSYIFFLYNLNASWILLIAISGWMFKKIIQDPLFILHTYILSLFTSRGERGRKEFVSLPSAIYMPHLGYSQKEIENALQILFLSYFNNQEMNPALIYHSDNREPDLIYHALKTIKKLAKNFNLDRVLLYQRNIHTPERNFLGKPGAYLADYQRMCMGIRQPLFYIEKEWDARLQYKIRLQKDKIIEEKIHIPFIPPERIDNSYRYFLLYEGGDHFLEEKIYLESEKGKFESQVDIHIYLVNKRNPEEFYRLYMGAIYDLDGRLLYSPKEWEMDSVGMISFKVQNPNISSGPYQLMVERVVFLNDRKFLLDKEMNIRDRNYHIFLNRGEYRITKKYLAYKRKGNFLRLVDQNFTPDEKKFTGTDLRRDPFQDMHMFPDEVIEKVQRDSDFDYFEKIQIKEQGLWGNERLVSGFKTGWEEEYFIPDKIHSHRIILKGGYYLIPEKLKPRDIFYSPYREREIVCEDKLYGVEKGKKFPLISLDGKEVSTPGDYSLIKAEFIQKLRPCDGGYVFNLNDGFIINRDGVHYLGEEVEFVSSVFQELSKSLLYIHPEDKSLRKRKLLSPPGGYEIRGEKIAIKNKILPPTCEVILEEGKIKIFNPLSSGWVALEEGWGINELGVYCDEVCEQNLPRGEIRYHNGYLFYDQVVAQEGDYKIVPGGVVIEGYVVPLGFVLEKKGEFLKYRGRVVCGDCSFFIINQIDSDGEFLKGSLDAINPLLSAQILFKEQFEFGMVQPEISFANSTESLFARLLSWAHEEFKFAERTLFNISGEANSYGKVSKALPLYVNNILIKEAIPSLARTHDHWEAMGLRTYLFATDEPKRGRIIENVPSNFYSFLKRKQGWLAGDLLLLTLESKLGTMINHIRTLLSFLAGKIKIAKFWENYNRAYFTAVMKNRKFYSALGLHRIYTLFRTTFSTTYLMLWLLTTGWVALVFPGALTARNQALAWMLFMVSIICIIILPKFFIPAWKLLLQELSKFSSLIYLGLIFAFCYYLPEFIVKFPSLPQIFLVLGYGYVLVRVVFLPLMFIIFGQRRRLRVRLSAFGGVLFTIAFLINLYDILDLIAENKNFYWIPYVLLHHMPYIFTYFLPLLLISHLFPLGRKAISTLKEGIKELTATTSTLLMLLVYEPFHILITMLKLILRPFQKITWLPQSYFDRKSERINSLLKAYLYFIFPPLFSIIVIIIPIKLHLITSRILIYGWPVFIWSWILGPFWAYWTARHRRDLNRQTPENIIARRIILNRFELDSIDLNNIEEMAKQVPFVNSEEDIIRVQLFILSQKSFQLLNSDRQTKIIKKAEEVARFQPDPRVTDWLTLSEFQRVKLLRPYKKFLPAEVWNQICYLEAFLFQRLKKGWAEVEWQNLSQEEKKKIKSYLIHKYHPILP